MHRLHLVRSVAPPRPDKRSAKVIEPRVRREAREQHTQSAAAGLPGRCLMNDDEWPGGQALRLNVRCRAGCSPAPFEIRRTAPGGERMDSKEIVERGTILRATVGSTIHGLHHGGQDDRDEMAVYVEPPEFMLGLARARGIRGGSTASSTTSSAHSPRASAPARATSTWSPTRYASTSGWCSRGTHDPAAAVRPAGVRPRRDRAGHGAAGAAADAALAARRAAATSATCTARRSGCSARAARSGSTGPSSSRRTATTRSTRCTPPGSATRASSCSRRAS